MAEIKTFPVSRVASSFANTFLYDYISRTNINGPNHSNFIYVLFWFMYYLLLSPYRLKKGYDGRYEIYSWRPQQALCAIMIFLGMINYTTGLRAAIQFIRRNDPVSFFNLFTHLSSVLFRIVLFSGLWRKKQAYLKLVNFASSSELPQSCQKFESLKILGLLFSIFPFFSILRFVLGSEVVNIWDLSPEWLFRRTVAQARYTFFLGEYAANKKSAPELSSISEIDQIIAIIQALSRLSRSLIGNMVDIFILCHIWILYAPVSAFSDAMYKKLWIITSNEFDIEDSNPARREDRFETETGHGERMRKEIDSAIQEFNLLKDLSLLVRMAMGDIMLPYFGIALFYYAMYFDVLLLTPDILERVVLSFYYISIVCIFVFSAEIIRKIKWFKLWLCEENRIPFLDQSKLSAVLDDLAHDAVAITGSNTFTINYSFLGTVGGVLITYFIIRLQSLSSAEGFL